MAGRSRARDAAGNMSDIDADRSGEVSRGQVRRGGRDPAAVRTARPQAAVGAAALLPRLSGTFVLVVGTASLLLARLSLGAGLAITGAELVLPVVVAVALAVACWFVPWARLPAGSTLVVPVSALGLVLFLDGTTDFTSTPGAAVAYPIYVILLLAWVGVSEPRVTALAFSPCVGAVMAYVLTRHASTGLTAWSLVVVLPIGVGVGETVAWFAARSRALDGREVRRADDLRRLARLLGGLAGLKDLDLAATLVAREATGLFGGEAASVELVAADGKTARAAFGHGGAHATSIALIGSQRTVGRVEVVSGAHATDDYFERLAELFAMQVGATVEQLYTISELDRDTRRDALTGTGNRRHAADLLDKLRPGEALMVIDLDSFKSVNDTWGHRAGDEVLFRLGVYLQTCVRGDDDVARLGGDEFVVVTRRGDDPMRMAQRLLEGWRQEGHPTTLSIGVARHHVGSEADDTLDRADAALYQAKSLGRDQVVLAAG